MKENTRIGTEMNKKAETNLKIRRIIAYLGKNDYEVAVFGRQDNFAWISSGGTNKILDTSEYGACLLLISKDKRLVIAYSMDGRRIIDEELDGLDFELIDMKWLEGDIYGRATSLLKNKKAVSDIYLKGADFKLKDLYGLHYPFTENEIEKLKWLSEKAEIIIYETVKKLKPNMTELEAQKILLKESADNEISVPVCLIGSDERISMYRHPLPSMKKIKKMLMLAPAFRKWGIFAPVTRMAYFGNQLGDDIKNKYEAVCKIEANVFSMCKPGTRFIDILERQKTLYKEFGFAEEWKNHFQGGLTGYFANDPTQYTNEKATIIENQSFNWYITITGVKVEEVFLSTSGLLSSKGLWPLKKYSVEGQSFALPQILVV
jgi:Xaa-Pro dipeptidase